MTFLPIVERELRLAARQSRTRQLRVASALLAVLVVGLAMVFSEADTGRAAVGSIVFRVLTTVLFVYASLSGVWLTADCLSEEKRDGTLGLLFLTDLRGYDVVLGKLAGRAVSGFYGLLAALPMLAMSILLGGVTLGEFWRVAALLVTALLLSLTVGMLVSSVSTQDQRAMGATFLILLGLNLAGWAARQFATPSRDWMDRLGCLSPANVCLSAYEGRFQGDPASFWWGLVWLQAVAWASLIAACLLLPRWWHREEPAERESAVERRRRALDRVEEGNPYAWLMRRTTLMSRRTLWLIVLVVLSTAAAMGMVQSSAPMVFTWLGALLALTLKVLLAFQAPRFFTRHRESGALELLITVPRRSREVVDGQVQAMQGLYWGPALLAALTQLAPASLGWWMPGTPVPELILISGLALYAAAVLVMDLYAIAWLGMLLALRVRRPRWVPLLLILYLLVLPQLLFCVPRILIDLPVIFAAQDRLRREFERMARRGYEGTTARSPFLPPPLPA